MAKPKSKATHSPTSAVLVKDLRSTDDESEVRKEKCDSARRGVLQLDCKGSPSLPIWFCVKQFEKRDLKACESCVLANYAKVTG